MSNFQVKFQSMFNQIIPRKSDKHSFFLFILLVPSPKFLIVLMKKGSLIPPSYSRLVLWDVVQRNELLLLFMWGFFFSVVLDMDDKIAAYCLNLAGSQTDAEVWRLRW